MANAPRCVRFVLTEIEPRSPQIAEWRAKYVPQIWRGLGDHLLYDNPDAADFNMRYGEMLDILAKSRCPSDALPRLALALVHQGKLPVPG